MATRSNKQVWRPAVKVVCLLDTVRVLIELVLCVSLVVAATSWGPIELNRFLYDHKNEDADVEETDNVTPTPDELSYYKMLTTGTQNNTCTDLKRHCGKGVTSLRFWLLGTKVLIWMSLIMTLTFCLIEVFVAWGLILACESNCEPLNASLNASVWKYAKIVLFCCSAKGFISILVAGPLGLKLLVGSKIVLGVTGVFVVQMFICEQDALVALQPVTKPEWEVDDEDLDE